MVKNYSNPYLQMTQEIHLRISASSKKSIIVVLQAPKVGYTVPYVVTG